MKTQKIHYDRDSNECYAGARRDQKDILLGWAVPRVPDGWHFSPQKEGLTYTEDILVGIADVLGELSGSYD